MTFEEALSKCKSGGKIWRENWNGARLGKVAFVVYQPAYPYGIPINANSARALGIPEGTSCAFEPYLMLAVKLEDGDERIGPKLNQFICRPWTPDMRDILADDWKLIYTE